jgi:hypothetical protein
MNCLKIIATYLGPRRQNNNNFSSEHQAKEYLNYSLNEIEANIDPGIKMDILIVNNCYGNEESKNFINFFNNKKLKKGRIFVSHRENDGGSFGAFSHGYSLFEDKYDYFIFNEDDIIITKSNYMEEVDFLFKENKNIGFISFSPISFSSCTHSGGGFGVTTNNILKNIVKDKSTNKLRYFNGTDYNLYERSEIEFTNCIVRSGLKLINHPSFSPLAENYKKHQSQNVPQYVTEENLSKPFLYKVGI